MFSPDDTIVAIATPPGRGGIGVVRISGPQATHVAGAILERRAPLQPRHATFTRVRRDEESARIDEVVATFFPAPRSYTGQDVIEVSAHGSPVVLQSIMRTAIDAGARLAQPGEFTLRAFLNGKLDLVQAEAVGDLIAAATPLQASVAFDQLNGTLTRRMTDIDGELFDLITRLEASLDFPDEGYHFIEPAETAGRIGRVLDAVDRLLEDAGRGRMIREGATVVIAGKPNVGKSSLFNVLVGAERAIVTEIPGTTRDLVTEQVDIEGLAVTLVDTAGTRDTRDIVEREGVARATCARTIADLVLVVLDQTKPLAQDDHRLLDETAVLRRIVVANKVDAGAGSAWPDAIPVSAKTGTGIADLRGAMARALTREESLRDTAVISNVRHVALLEEAREHLRRALAAARVGDTPEEFLLTDLQAARTRFDEIVGTRTTEDVLRNIFERFCIGK
jgi:tRNA modification GTPase